MLKYEVIIALLVKMYDVLNNEQFQKESIKKGIGENYEKNQGN